MTPVPTKGSDARMTKILSVVLFLLAELDNDGTLAVKIGFHGDQISDSRQAVEKAINGLARILDRKNVHIKGLKFLSIDQYQKMQKGIPPDVNETFIL